MPDPDVIPDSDAPVEGDPPTGESADAEESAGGPAGSDSQPNDAPVESAAEVQTEASSPQQRVIDSPPPAARPLKQSDAEPRVRLHQLANELVRNRNRRLLIEFLQLRRALQ
jgi:hypothetical protein